VFYKYPADTYRCSAEKLDFRAADPAALWQLFAIPAMLYYTLVYPFAVGIGVCSGFFSQHFGLRP
jgi:hypothetical protein